jgi:hypothetical protein
MNNAVGCVLILGLVLVMGGVAGVISAMSGGRDGFVGSVVVIMLGVLVWWGLISAGNRAAKAADTRKDKIRTLVCETADGPFDVTHEYVSPSGMVFLAIDEGRSKIKVGGLDADRTTIKSRTIDIGSVIGVQLYERGQAVQGSSAGDVLSLAAVGGLLFGGAGAVVGAVTGQQTKNIRDISLAIGIDDVSTPMVVVNFLEPGQSNPDAALAEARKWLGSITVLINRRDRETKAAIS